MYHTLQVLKNHLSCEEATNQGLYFDYCDQGALINFDAVLIIFFIAIEILFGALIVLLGATGELVHHVMRSVVVVLALVAHVFRTRVPDHTVFKFGCNIIAAIHPVHDSRLLFILLLVLSTATLFTLAVIEAEVVVGCDLTGQIFHRRLRATHSRTEALQAHRLLIDSAHHGWRIAVQFAFTVDQVQAFPKQKERTVNTIVKFK